MPNEVLWTNQVRKTLSKEYSLLGELEDLKSVKQVREKIEGRKREILKDLDKLQQRKFNREILQLDEWHILPQYLRALKNKEIKPEQINYYSFMHHMKEHINACGIVVWVYDGVPYLIKFQNNLKK